MSNDNNPYRGAPGWVDPEGLREVPRFGIGESGVVHTVRPAAYAVIWKEGKVAAVDSGERYFLPGGGAEPGETPEQTILREISEELGYGAVTGRTLGAAVQFFCADGCDYEMHAVFLEATLTEHYFADSEHELLWIDPVIEGDRFYHECHRWGIQRSTG